MSDTQSKITFNNADDKEILRLTNQGMYYQGKFIGDGGEAYSAFLKTMEVINAGRDEELKAVTDQLSEVRELVRTIELYMMHCDINKHLGVGGKAHFDKLYKLVLEGKE